LYQDIPSEKGNCAQHLMLPPYDRVCHSVKIIDDTLLSNIIGAGETGVNSYHHQGVENIAPNLKMCASAEDGLCEGLYAPDKTFFLGIQWHPELNYRTDEKSMKIFEAFARACEWTNG
jgi:putative glutamine amidotransferase